MMYDATDQEIIALRVRGEQMKRNAQTIVQAMIDQPMLLRDAYTKVLGEGWHQQYDHTDREDMGYYVEQALEQAVYRLAWGKQIEVLNALLAAQGI